MTDRERYILSRWMYSIGRPIITDAEYTVLHNFMLSSYPSDEYVNRSWSSDPCPVDLLKKYGMEDSIKEVILTDKTESIASLNSLADVKAFYGSLDEEVTVSYKHDGWNIQYSYYNGELVHVQTRGRLCDAKDASVFKTLVPNTIPVTGKVKIVTEVTVPNSKFPIIQRDFGNTSQRGSVSTVLANPEYLHCVEAHALDIKASEDYDIFPTLLTWGFKVPAFRKVRSYADLMTAVKELSEQKASYDSPTDGVVVKGTETKALRIMAWEEPIYTSYITGYKEEYGPHRISAALEIFPVKTPTGMQRVLPITNLNRIVSNNLKLGTPIAFRFVSGAIADVDLETTRKLQKIWAYRDKEYQQHIEITEIERKMLNLCFMV